MKRAHRWAVVAALFLAAAGAASAGGELRMVIRSEPKNLHPLKASDEASELMRYFTSGALIRLNRRTQQFEPWLASQWRLEDGGRRIRFRLRDGVRFSDGTPFTAEDVAYTFRVLLDPATASPSADAFLSGGRPEVRVLAADQLEVNFPKPIAGIERLFDQLAILSARSPNGETAVLGPFWLAHYEPGSYLLLRRNPHYFQRDERGVRLPYLDAVRLEILQNRETELLRFRRGQIHLIANLDPELYLRLQAERPDWLHNSGPSLEAEQLWFNLAEAAPIEPYKKAWFRSAYFRQAISHALRRQDYCRIVYRGLATPAAGPVSPADRFWFNRNLQPASFDPGRVRRLLEQAGFKLEGGKLRDSQGHAVEFSLVTNAGNRNRERLGAMIQQDLAEFGIRLNLVTLDFAALIERITRTFQYEACLLSLANLDLDPNSQMNVWLSSGSHHAWNPNQKAPATTWEAEIDRLMRAQAAALEPSKRKALFDRVQQIVAEQAPVIYLVHKNVLSAVRPELRNVEPAAVPPQLCWNIERLYLVERR